MTRLRRIGAAALAASFGIGCGYRNVPPPESPAPVTPKAAPLPTLPKAGFTRLLLDANGEPAVVTEVVDSTSAFGTASVGLKTAFVQASSATLKPVCLTPCYVDLEPGLHALQFTSRTDDRASTALVQVASESKVIRHSMGRTEPYSLAALGSDVLFVSGLTVALLGTAIYALADPDSRDLRQAKRDGLTAAGIGAGAMIVSIPLMLLTQPVHQPGATREIPLE